MVGRRWRTKVVKDVPQTLGTIPSTSRNAVIPAKMANRREKSSKPSRKSSESSDELTQSPQTASKTLQSSKNESVRSYNKISTTTGHVASPTRQEQSSPSPMQRSQQKESSGKLKRQTKTKPKKMTPILRKTIHMQNGTNLLLPKLPFQRLVRETVQKFQSTDLRLQSDTLLALQESSELYLCQMFEDSYWVTARRKSFTLHPLDMQVAQCFRGPLQPAARNISNT